MYLIQLHKGYLWNKVNRTIIYLILLISILLELILIKPFTHTLNIWTLKMIDVDNYCQASFFFSKIVLILFSIYVFGIGFSQSGDNYSIVITTRISHWKYYCTKFFSIGYGLGKIVVSFFLIHINIGFLFSKWYILDSSIWKAYGEMYWLALVYGALAIVSVRVGKSIYALFIPICLYIVSEVIIDFNIGQQAMRIFQLFLPIQMYNGSRYILIYGLGHTIILAIFYMLIAYITYTQKQ
ncbi:MAG: hypothetical protein NC182_04420 [Prevotella sp.]|nr:hypothetical protein [Staphylococcus sp.]MCM1350427.1 hypothetical protein [Prevotella sp.]